MKRNARVLIVKNVRREGPGLLGEIFRDRAIRMKIVDLSKGEAFPEVAGFDGVVVLGGPDSANDATPKMKREVLRVREALKLGIPYLGICLGMQVLAKAAGGKVLKSPAKEVGWYEPLSARPFEVRLNVQGRKDRLFIGIPRAFRVFELHGETVKPVPGTKLLGIGAFCRHQIIKAGPAAYGFQPHLELTEGMLRRWIREDADLRPFRRNPSLLKEWKAVRGDYLRTGRRVIANFANLIQETAARKIRITRRPG